MYKTVFQNSKAALAFAAMTIFGAVSMVGTSEDSGLVGKAVDVFGAQRAGIASDAQAYAEQQSVGDKPGKAGAGWGDDGAVFGDYEGETAAAKASGASGQQSASPMSAPLSSTAIVVDRGGTTVSAVPFISEREMTIEPE